LTAGEVVRDGPTPEQRAQFAAVGAATGLGCAIVVTLILFIGGGVLLDRQFDTSPLLTLVGVALALVGAGYQLYELTLVGRRDRAAGPLGRRLARPPQRPAGRRLDGEE
jgi:Putative F0F1-ATPase subunit Ca2+/Mg2+ transporter